MCGHCSLPPVIESILEQVQIDHTVIDLIVVDERERQPIGRPYLTVAIDGCSRCILGMVVTLEVMGAGMLAMGRTPKPCPRSAVILMLRSPATELGPLHRPLFRRARVVLVGWMR